MGNKNLLNHMYKRTWTGKIAMTDQSLGRVVLIAAVAGATATMLIMRRIKRIIMQISAPVSSKAGGNSPSELHETARSAEFPQSYMDHE